MSKVLISYIYKGKKMKTKEAFTRIIMIITIFSSDVHFCIIIRSIKLTGRGSFNSHAIRRKPFKRVWNAVIFFKKQTI